MNAHQRRIERRALKRLVEAERIALGFRFLWATQKYRWLHGARR